MRMPPLLLFALIALLGCAHQPEADRHVLAGRLWDAHAERFIDQTEFLGRVREAQVVLLGETHDNPDHHELQQRALDAVLSAGRRPALVMEQFDTSQQALIDATLGLTNRSIIEVVEVGTLNRASWDWRFYMPLIDRALKHDLPIAAANLSRADSRQVAAKGFGALGDERARRLGFEEVWSELRQERLASAIAGGHCGQMPEQAVPGLVKSQRAKDGVMADVLAGHVPRGAIGILGRGHVRKDLGVPLYLQRLAPEAKVLSVGMVEAEPGIDDPRRYARYPRKDDGPLYDIVAFGRKVARKDPCADFDPKKLAPAASGPK